MHYSGPVLGRPGPSATGALGSTVQCASLCVVHFARRRRYAAEKQLSMCCSGLQPARMQQRHAPPPWRHAEQVYLCFPAGIADTQDRSVHTLSIVQAQVDLVSQKKLRNVYNARSVVPLVCCVCVVAYTAARSRKTQMATHRTCGCHQICNQTVLTVLPAQGCLAATCLPV